MYVRLMQVWVIQLCVLERPLLVMAWDVHWRPARFDGANPVRWFLPAVVQVRA